MHEGTYSGNYEVPTDPTPPTGSSSGGTAVPEPGMLAMFGLGLVALGLLFHRRRSAAGA